jgi:hypothetical protein
MVQAGWPPRNLLVWPITCPDNAGRIRTLFLVAGLLAVPFPASLPAGDWPPARHARPKKSREAKAKAKLARIKLLIGAGKYKTARRRLQKLLWDYPGTVAALQAYIMLGVLED